MPPTQSLETSRPILLDSLRSIRFKVKTFSFLFGAGLVVAAAVGLLLAVVLLDYLLNMPVWPRLILVLAVIAAVVHAFWRYLARPLFSRLSIGDVAGHLENAFPQFEDRLRSTVDFVRPEVPGSPIMKRFVVDQAGRMASQVDLGQAVLKKPVLYAVGGALAGLVLMAALAAAFPGLARIAISRLLMVNSQPWPKSVEINVIGEIPSKVAEGQPIELTMRLTKGDRKSMRAYVYVEYDSGASHRQLMERAADGSYGAVIQAKGSAMRVWMEAGDDSTQSQSIMVVPPLLVKSVEATVIPPPYARRLPLMFQGLPGLMNDVLPASLAQNAASYRLGRSPIPVTNGSIVQLTLTFNKPLSPGQSATIEPAEKQVMPAGMQWLGEPSGDVRRVQWTLTQALRFKVRGTDTDNFQNATSDEYSLGVRDDQLPTVEITAPAADEDRTAQAFVNLEAVARDDSGISTMALIVDRLGDKQHWEIPFSLGGEYNMVESSAEKKSYLLHYKWELSQLAGAQLKPDDVLQFAVRVTDNYRYNGTTHPPVLSSPRKIKIISQQELERQVTLDLQKAFDRTQAAQNSQNRTKAETANLRRDVQDKAQPDATDRGRMSRLSDQESMLSAQTRRVADNVAAVEQRLAQNRSENQELQNIANDAKSTLSQAADKTMPAAQQKLSEAANLSDPQNVRNNANPANRSNPQNSRGNPDAAKSSNPQNSRGNPDAAKSSNPQNSRGNPDAGKSSNPQNARNNSGAATRPDSQNERDNSGATTRPDSQDAPNDSGATTRPDSQDSGGNPDAANRSNSQNARSSANRGNRSNSQNSRGNPDGANRPDQQNPQDTPSPQEQRDEALQQSEEKQQEASEQLSKAMEKLGTLQRLDAAIGKVSEALQKQQQTSKELQKVGRDTIGKKPEELSDQQKKDLERIAEEQKKQSENTDKITQELNKSAEQTQKSDPAASQAMQQAARQSQQQQVSQRQSQAAQQAQQNQQASAQAQQLQAQLGLQMMLDSLREAQRRKLEQLKTQLSQLQQLLDDLIRRQSGHNIDNLRIQGVADAIKQITDELLQQADRAKDAQPAQPTTEQLTRSQMTTQGNTVDVAKVAEALPAGGAEISAAIARAADHMERAIILLKGNTLAEAYDPNQVKALAALEDARQKVAKAQADVEAQVAEANRESLRQAYEKIRAEQEVVNKETTRIDGAERLPDGSLKREDAVALRALPETQSKLAERVQKLDDSLTDLESVVYKWANTDIVSSMNEVKDDLAKPTTGQPTQIEQQRILDQLDVMIKSLASKPRQQGGFNPPPGDNGGGQGQGQGQPPKPRMPSEPELRLLKGLQLAINKATKLLDNAPKPDQAKSVAVGNRQGEIRNLLDQLVQKASDGKVKLDPEPDPKDRLPEEADTGAIENQEFDQWLRGGKSGDDQLANDLKMAGQRMARSRQRLALDNDPGKTTQAIQERIVMNMDNLIEMARQQAAQARAQGRQQQRQPRDPRQGRQQGQQIGQNQQQQPGVNPAQVEAGGRTDPNADLSKPLQADANEWGRLTPKERKAVIDGMNDRVLPKFKQLIDDYFEMMSKRGANEQR